MNLEEYLEHHRRVESQYTSFFSRLHADSVTLPEMLRNQEQRERIDAAWLDISLFRTVLNNTLDFLSQIPRVGGVRDMMYIPIVFFQKPDTELDEQKHREYISSGERYARLFKGVTSDIKYTGIVANFSSLIKDENGRIPSHLQFSKASTLPRDDNGTAGILGYQLPNLPRLLGVSDQIATNYISRMIIHDIGHFLLPNNTLLTEPLHNITMINAMLPIPRPTPSSAWERLILDECSDPYFFLDAKKQLQEFSPETPLQKYVTKQYQKWYASRTARARWSFLWNIHNPNAPREESCEHVRKKLQDLVTRSFSQYA